MSKVLKTVGTIAAGVALIATGVGAFGGAALLGTTAATLTSVATYASIASSVAMIGTSLLQKPPAARGSVSQVVIVVDPPRPYVMGEGYVGGVRRKDVAYGGTVDDVPNPYRLIVDVYCGHGPIHSITPYFDYAAVSSYYSGYLGTSTQLGACPESSALALTWSGAPGWTSASKLSGNAAIAWNLKFDKSGQKYASGVPVMGAYGKWVRVYDPRLDSTFPGGSGTHRLGNEATYGWSENPALHYGTYAYGRTQNGKRVVGIGLPSIDWATIAAWANVCDANRWTIFGRVFEPGDRWANLKDIAIAGGAQPAFSGGMLSARYSAPATPLGTITEADLGEGQWSYTAMQGYAQRINTVIAKRTDPAANWEQVAIDPVQDPALVTADGEERRQEWPLNLVKGLNQAAQLAMYRIYDSREKSPIELPLLPQWRTARPGECYTLNLPSLGLTGPAIVLKRSIDPATFGVKLTLMGETAAKHSAALSTAGTTSGGISSPSTGADRDAVAAALALPPGYVAGLIGTSYATDADPADGLIQALPTSITVESHTRTYSDKTVSVTGATLTVEADGTTAIAASTTYHVYYDDAARLGGAVTLKATRTATTAANTPAQPYRHYVGSVTTPVTGTTTAVTGGGALPPGWRGSDWYA